MQRKLYAPSSSGRFAGAAAEFLRKNTVAVVAFAAACISATVVPPDAKYADYFDFKTLTCLFCTLAVICALKNIRFFTIIARKIVERTGNMRTLTLALVYITFAGSMIIANDMALITFLPLGYFALSDTGKDKYAAMLFILQNIAANLGGMLTPFGNPQNLYLYTLFNIPNGEFLRIMALPFAVSVVLITACCLFFPNEKLVIREKCDAALPKGKTALLLAVFAVTILIVFRIIPYPVGLAVTVLAILFCDRKALMKVDYPLLFTFAAFFVFAGNMARIPAVNYALSALLDKNALLSSVASCQLISNVPTAILMSRFTSNYAPLLVGVNIGGVRTLISSLASLITLREYTSRYKNQTKKYILMFSAFNFGFLFILTPIMYLALYVI